MWPFNRKKKEKSNKRSYQAAMIDRLVSDWMASTTSADAEIRGGLLTVRNRSRDLARNNDYYRNILKLFQVNVIGEGMPFQAQIRMQRGGLLDSEMNSKIESEFNKWAKAESCDVSGKLSFYEMQGLAIRAPAQDGDVFFRKIKQSFGKSKIPAALEIIEADLCDEQHNEDLGGGRVIRMGIEYNEWMRPVAYHFTTKHPGDNGHGFSSNSRKIRVPADEVIHVFKTERPRQGRGMPWLTSGMMKMHHMNGYMDAEVIGARASSSLMGFIESPEGQIEGDSIDGGQRVTEFEPGVFKQLNPGEKMNVPQLNKPGNQFAPFMQVMLRGIAAGAGISYESVSRDYSTVTYSSARQALLEDRDYWKVLQSWSIEQFSQKVIEFWLDQAVLSGVLNLPKYFQDSDKYYSAIKWMPRGWNWVDPGKETAANLSSVRSGFMTASQVVAQMGGDYEELVAQRAREIEIAKKYGVKFDSDLENDQPKVTQQAPSDTEEDDPEEDKVEDATDTEGVKSRFDLEISH